MMAAPTKYDKLVQRGKNHRVIVALIILTAIVGGLGVWIGTGKALLDLVRPAHAAPDPGVFLFKDQTMHFAGGNGLSMANAVVIEGALTIDAGIAAEYYWIHKFYPDHTVTRLGALSGTNPCTQHYDVFGLRSRSGIPRIVYFDCTSWFGTAGSNSKEQQTVDDFMMQVARMCAQQSNPTGASSHIVLTPSNAPVTNEVHVFLTSRENIQRIVRKRIREFQQYLPGVEGHTNYHETCGSLDMLVPYQER